MIRYIELIEPFDQNGYVPNSVMASSPNGDWVLYSEAQAEIDALKAERDVLLAAQQWQSIESAPTNQTVLLAGEFAGEGDWRIKCGYFCSERNFWCIWGASWTPTHWQPLPPPPEAKARVIYDRLA